MTPPDKTLQQGRAALCSLGMWRLRDDIAALLGIPVTLARPLDGASAYVGWGRRPSWTRAAALARRNGASLYTVEDGFLSGYQRALDEPRHSYVVDTTGIYFDTRSDNDLERLIRSDEPGDDEWAKAMIRTIVEQRTTKFNGWELQSGDEGLPPREPYLLVVDQVPGDASIIGAGADAARFEAMLRHAADSADGRSIVIRTHPATLQASPLVAAAKAAGINFRLSSGGNPWPLLEQADGVWTISSQLGFEAAMAGKPVHAFGRSFYAGRGFTNDHFADGPQAQCSLFRLFSLFYGRYMRCLDLHTRQPCSFDIALEQAIVVRDQRDRLARPVFTGGLSPWKRQAVGPMLVGRRGRPTHCITRAAARRQAAARQGVVAEWGARQAGQDDALFVEDGFIRSRGLGAELVMPASLVLDSRGAHFDCSRPTDIETLLQNRQFSEAELRRAQQLRQALVASGVTKYNVGDNFAGFPEVEAGQLRILVPGQVESDASIRFGSPHIRTNKALVEAVRRLFPSAFIAYKVHPDAVAGMRAAGNMPEGHDFLATNGSAHQWIEWADRVETMTSLTGFEALLRNRQVGVHGVPAYAGWGLTDDRLPAPRRTRVLSLDELVAGLLIAYPYYVHPASRLPCKPEELVQALADPAAQPARQTSRLSMTANRLAIRLRDRKAG